MSAKLRPYTGYSTPEAGTLGYHFWCPGCREIHTYRIKQYRDEQKPIWQFNGNEECPTFTPSLLYAEIPRSDASGVVRCHLYLTDGKLHFLGDCTHDLKGKTVDLPEWPEGRP